VDAWAGKPQFIFSLYWPGGEQLMPTEPGHRPATKASLTSARKRLLETVQRLSFGRIERLLIRDGNPCYEREPRIIEEIKLTSDPSDRADCGDGDFTIKREFENLFGHLDRLQDGIVDLEIRHSLPFRLIVDRGRHGEADL
jgi:hypothetical protein